MILASAVLAAAVVCVSPVVQVYEVLQAELPCVLGQVDGVHVLQRQTQSCETDTETQTRRDGENRAVLTHCTSSL